MGFVTVKSAVLDGRVEDWTPSRIAAWEVENMNVYSCNLHLLTRVRCRGVFPNPKGALRFNTLYRQLASVPIQDAQKSLYRHEIYMCIQFV